MSPDVLTELRAYATHLDDQAPNLDELMPAATETRPSQPKQPVRRRWVAAVLAAAVVMILIGGVALVGSLFGSDEEIIDEPTPTITTPESSPAAGRVWAQVSDPAGAFKEAIIVGIASGPNQLVAAGNVSGGVAVWTSAEGLTWARVPHDDSIFGPGEDNWVNVVGAAASEDGFVILGVGGKDDAQTPLAWFSADGSTWTRVPFAEANTQSTLTEIRAISAGGPGFVAVGSGCDAGCSPWAPYPMVWTSADGTEWTAIGNANALFLSRTVLTEIVAYDGRLWAFGYLAGDGQDYRVWTSTDGLTWERVTDDSAFGGPGNQGLGAAAAGDGGVVAAGFNWTEETGNEPIAWYSPDGSSWTRIELEPRFAGLTVWDMAASGTGFVAVGNAGDMAFELGLPFNFVLRSGDGLSWEKIDDPSYSNAQFLTVTAGGPGLVAAGSSHANVATGKAPIWTSAPGSLPTTDTTVPPATTTTSTTVISEPLPAGEWTRWPVDFDVWNGGVSDIVTGGPGVVAVGGGIWLSEDGITWVRPPDGSPDLEGSWFMHALTAGENGLVAVGDGRDEVGALAWFSPDGLEWSRSVLPNSVQAFDVVATKSGYVAVGRDEGRFEGDMYVEEGAVWSSVDGITWHRVPDDSAVFENAYPSAIVRTDDGLVAVGMLYQDTGFGVWTSPDGATWTKHVADTGFPGPGHLSDLTIGSPGLLAIGDFGGPWLSHDGVTWQDVSQPDFRVRSVASLGDGFIAVGQSCNDSECMTAVWASADGIDWTRETPEPGFFEGEMSAVRAAGPGLIAFSTIYSGPGDASGIGHWTWGS
jgi:hypothetical protein